MFMIFGPSGNVHDPKKPYFDFVSAEIFSKYTRQTPSNCWKTCYLGNCRISTNEQNDVCRNILELGLNNSEHLEYGIDIFKNMKSNCDMFELN